MRLIEYFRIKTTRTLASGREATLYTVMCPFCRDWNDTEEVMVATADTLARLLDDQTDRWTAHVNQHTLGEAINRIAVLETYIKDLHSDADQLEAIDRALGDPEDPTEPSSRPG